MAKTRLYLLDTTLRDGQQTTGVDFSLADKQEIAAMLDELGVDYIEGGYPGANPVDDIFFAKRPPLASARFTAFGMTKRAGRSAANDPGLAAALAADADSICLVAKSWDFHVATALGISQKENLTSIAESVRAVVQKKREAMIDCEHFFDGFKANPTYALACARAAHDSGARWVVLCDTNGGCLPHEVEEIVAKVARHVPAERLGIHAHNDTENAVANTLAAVGAGVRQIQGTLNGLGERCGNANLVSLLPTLLLKDPYRRLYQLKMARAKLTRLTKLSRRLDDILNRPSDRHAPYVGESAFAHKGGIHVSAVMKDSRTYEHVRPRLVGNQRQIVVSDQAGRSTIVHRLRAAGIRLKPQDARVTKILRSIKAQGFEGVSYDGAEASFELFARRQLGRCPEFFQVRHYRVTVAAQRENGAWKKISHAEVQLEIDGEAVVGTGEGDGPVHALDRALRQDLKRYHRYIKDWQLVDYKVRILSRGTDAVTRVLLESADRQGRQWRTMGVSSNIVEASFHALMDSLTYKLLCAGAKPKA